MKRILILGANISQVMAFVGTNKLERDAYTRVTSPQELRGYDGGCKLILLHGWSNELPIRRHSMYREELYWFALKNKVVRMKDTEELNGEIV